ncbi:unnamed protein product [Effrenium voratum]|nr:unnamed protein product [Effrenium voratum]
MSVRLRSRDGDVFEVGRWLIDLSPVLSSTESDDEIPLPLIGTFALKLLLAHCQEYRSQGRWILSRKLSCSDLEKLFGAAHFLALERLAGLCAAKLAELVLKQDAALQLSPRTLRRLLDFRGQLPPEALCAVITASALEALEAVARHRGHAHPEVRLAVVQAMSRAREAPEWIQSRLQVEKEPRIQQALLSCLQHSRSAWSSNQISKLLCFLAPARVGAVRLSALDALSAVAVPDDAAALAALLGAPPYGRQGLRDTQPAVRLRALQALRQLVAKNRSLQLLEAVAALLQDMDDQVRQEAVDVLAWLGKGNVAAIQGAVDCLRHSTSTVRSCGIKALRLVARGNSAGVAGILQRMAAPNCRGTCVLALLAVLPPLDALKVCISCLARPGTREAVPECLATLRAQIRKPKAVARTLAAALPKYLASKEPCTRLWALRSLRAADTPKRLLARAGLRLLDKELSVRQEACLVAERLSSEQRVELLSPLVAQLSHNHGRQRLVAAAFARLADPRTDRFVALLAPALRHRLPKVRLAASAILCQLSTEQGPAALQVAVQVLAEGPPEAKDTSFRALAAILEGSKKVLDLNVALPFAKLRPHAALALARRMGSGDELVRHEEFVEALVSMLFAGPVARRYATQALQLASAVPSEGGARAVRAVARLLQHHRWQVRWSAVAVLLAAPRTRHVTKAVKDVAAASPQRFVRDVAEYVLRKEDDRSLCQQVNRLAAEDENVQKRPRVKAERKRKFARLVPGRSHTLHLD